MANNQSATPQQNDKVDSTINSQDKVNPQDKVPDSLAEATTAPLDDGALGGHATQDDAK